MTSIITANIGGIDEVHAPAKQKREYEFIYLTENNLPFPLPNFDNRMKGKYLKTQLHTFLNHDVFIWIDASVEVTDGTFIDWVEQKLKNHEFVCSLHPERDNVFQELDHIQEQISKGSPYLIERYAKQPFEQEKNFYKSQRMPDYPLFNGWFFVVKNNERMNKVMNMWWQTIIRYSNFDQSQLSYVLWKNNVKVNAVEPGNYLKRHKHL